jgi:hypothetical protein
MLRCCCRVNEERSDPLTALHACRSSSTQPKSNNTSIRLCMCLAGQQLANHTWLMPYLQLRCPAGLLLLSPLWSWQPRQWCLPQGLVEVRLCYVLCLFRGRAFGVGYGSASMSQQQQKQQQYMPWMCPVIPDPNLACSRGSYLRFLSLINNT